MHQVCGSDRYGGACGRGRSGARLAALLAAAALVLAACGGPQVPDLAVADAPSSPAPPWDAHLVEAGWPEMAAFIARENARGRPVVVNYFASWCAPCRAEAPLLRAVANENRDVAFLGVATRDRREDSAAFLDEEQLTFPTLWDWPGDLADVVEARGMPTTAFFDHEGQLVATHTGLLTEAMLAPRLADLEAAAAAAGR